MISYNTFDLENEKFELKVWEEGGKIVLLLEQSDGSLYLTFPNEARYQQFRASLG